MGARGLKPPVLRPPATVARSGGDQSVRGAGGYVGADGIPRLNVLDLQMQASFSGC